jgi:predicted phage terminase large subunit-like protein
MDPALAPFQGLTRDEIATLVGRLSTADVMALHERLPRAEVAEDVAARGPAEFARALDPGYRLRPHVRLLSDAIRRTVEDAQNGTGSGRLIVSMPPRVGKSWTSSLWTPAWFLERHPDRNVILASHESNYAVSWGRKVRDALRRASEQGTTQVRVSRDVAAAGEWQTTQGGGMLSRGIGGSITGRGGHLFLIDDPIKDFAQAHSAAVRQAQWDWWLAVAGTRLEPGAAVVVVMTRWHEDDLAGRLTSAEHEGDPDEWTTLRIPAVAEDEDDPLGRAIGEPLLLASSDEDRDQATARWRKVRTQVGPYIWQGMYQQNPSEPEGTILKRRWWQYYRREGDRLILPDGTSISLGSLRIVQSWDLAFKDRTTSDFVAGQVWGAQGQARRFLLDEFHDRADYVATKRAMLAMRAKWPHTSATYVEDKANGPAILSDLRDEISGLVPNEPKGDKVQRAYGIQGDLEGGSLWLPAPGTAGFDVRAFVDECGQFPTGAHDDRVDALTQAILRLRTARTDVESPVGRQPGARRLPQSRRQISR